MKLLQVKSLEEGEISPLAYISFGRKLESTGKYNGYYLIIKSPFKKQREVVDVDFNHVYALTQKIWRFQCRKTAGTGDLKFNYFTGHVVAS